MRTTRREGGWRKERLWWTPKEIVWPVGDGWIGKISTQMGKQLKRAFFLDVTPCSLREIYRCIGGMPWHVRLDLLTYVPALGLMLPIHFPLPHAYYISCRADLKILHEECILGSPSFYELLHPSLTSSHLGLNVLQHHFVLKYISLCSFLWKIRLKGEAIPVTGCGGPYGCETSKLPHFLDNRLIDGGKVVSFTRRPPFTPRNTPGTNLC
jgi:hypothetical protein